MSEQDHFEEEIIEAYCVSCKQTGEIIDPIAVWTSKGQPGTKGTCFNCGGNVFRMGRTHLHGDQKAPDPVHVIPSGVKKTKATKAAFIAAAVTDADFAAKLGDDLHKLGVYVWVDNGETALENVQWSSGVHPAYEQCTHLIVVLSGFTENTSAVQAAWQFFLGKRKPVLVVQTEAIDPPDELRSRPRFDFTDDYKTAFRGLMEALSR